jgi:hypothetical protein
MIILKDEMLIDGNNLKFEMTIIDKVKHEIVSSFI